jgi:hypothetical protein
MVRLPLWFGLLGAPLVFAASCSSDDASKAPPQLVAGGGGESAGAAPDDGGSAPKGGTANAAAGTEAGGQGGGGGDETSAMTDGWSSGTRLRAVLDAAGDAKLFKLWHDAELDVDCAFAPAADGVERCMPAVERGYAVYSDAKCTKPVALFAADDAIPPFIAEPHRALDCGKGGAYLEVGAAAAGVTAVYGFSNENCVANGMVGATQLVKQLGAVVPTSMFVAATKTVHEARDPRLAANVLVAEDGSRQVTSHFDLARKADCNPIEPQAAGYACVPKNLAFIEVFFSDDKCKVPAAYHPPCNGEPAIILDASPHNTGQYFEVGAKVATPAFRNYSTTCEPDTSPREPGAGFYAIGKEAPWAGFPQLSAKNEGKGRIAINVLRGASDELVARQNFVDTELNVNCSVGQSADLKPHCIPQVGGASVNVFADAKCSSGLYEIKAGDPLPDGLEFLNANAPGGGTATFKIGAKVAPPAQAWQLSGLNCQLYSVAAGVDYYATTSIPPGDLALVTREVE